MSKISKCLSDFVCFVKNLKMFLPKSVKNLKMLWLFANFKIISTFAPKFI